MAVTVDDTGHREVAGQAWYAQSPDAVAAALHVDPADGLSGAEAATRLAATGPNALPEEEPEPGWRRFLAQYRSYMQLILIAAAVVSALIAEWGTAVLLVALTVLNAVVGLRQQGKAESAMNALKSMVKATARVRRDGTELELDADQLVPGDVVILAAGGAGARGRADHRRQRPADRRVRADRGERAGGQARLDAAGRRAQPRRPDQHGVHEHAGHARQRRADRHRHRRGHRARQDLRDAVRDGQGGVAAHPRDGPAHAVDRGRRRPDADRDVRPRPQPRRGLGHPVRRRRLAGDRRDPGGAADRDPDDPVAGRRSTWPSATRSSRTSRRSRPSASPRRSTRTRPGR